MSFFLSSISGKSAPSSPSSSSKNGKQETSASYGVHPSWFLQPELDDMSCQREVEMQRFKFKDFIKSRKGNVWDSEMDWLWRRDVSYHKEAQKSAFFLTKKIKETFNYKTIARKELKALLRGGVPPELRGDVWWRLSGAEQKRNPSSPEYEAYSVLSSPKRLQALKNTTIAHDIEKDLNRTFPERQAFMHNFEGFIEILRRVLSTYALRNPVIGYCQSMNYLCALLLFHMNEEKAYWTFCALVENIMPANYYEPSLIGGRIDQQVFQSCIASRLPEVFNQFKATDTLLEPIICPWFLCLYINVLPCFTVCRIWDCLFWEGSQVIFRFGLTLIESKMKSILECTDFVSIYCVMKRGGVPSFCLEPSATNNADSPDDPGNLSDSQHLVESTFGSKWLKFVPPAQIASLRLKFKEIMVLKYEADEKKREAGKEAKERERKEKDQEASCTQLDDVECSIEASPCLSSSTSAVATSSSSSASSSSSSSPSPTAAAATAAMATKNRTRQSLLLLSTLGDADVQRLHELRAELDEGLGGQIEQFARELNAEGGGKGNSDDGDDDED